MVMIRMFWLWFEKDIHYLQVMGWGGMGAGGGVFRTPSNFAAFGDPLTVKYIEMFQADNSYLSIY